MSKRNNLHFRELPSFRFSKQELTDDWREFFTESVLPRISLRGYKKDQKRELLSHMVHQLVTTTLAGACVSDTRDWHEPGAKLRLQLWDAIEDAGLLRKCVGSESSGFMTRYRATGRLLELQERWELQLLYNMNLMRNTMLDNAVHTALVVIHSGKMDLATGEPLAAEQCKQPISIREYVKRKAQRGPDGKPDPRAIKNGLEYWQGVEDVVDRINRSNLSFSWQAFSTDRNGREYAFQPNVCLRQVHVGKAFRAARLYSFGHLSGQNLSKDVRRGMLIDGEPTAELDFSGMAPRMLYHFAKHDVKGDVYRPERIFPEYWSYDNAKPEKKTICRDFIKRATNICFNVASYRKANSAVHLLLKEHPQRAFLRQVIYHIEESDPSEIIKRIRVAHPKLKEFFFTSQGVELMTVDGNIMKHALLAFADAKKPALGIHDAICCRASDAEFAREAMADAYFKFMLFEPVIKRAF